MPRTAKPTKIKELQGSRTPKRTKEPNLPAVKLKPPRWLSKFAREEWYRVVPALEKIGMLTALDETAMVNYVVVYDRIREAQKIIEQEGFTCTTRDGGLKKRPELSVIAEALPPPDSKARRNKRRRLVRSGWC